MATYRDSQRRSLDEYPRPSVATDAAVLTVRDGIPLLPDTFRRSLLASLIATGDYYIEGRGRPAELYRRA